MQLAYGEWLLRMSDASVRSVALAAMAALVALFLRRRPSAQHALWSLVLGSMLLLPVMRPMVPVTHIDVTPEFAKAVGVPATRLAVGPLPPVHAGSRAPLTRLDWVLLLWAAGVMVFSLRLLAGLLLARKTFRRTVRLEFGAGLPIEESSRVRVPVTVGLWRPKVVLPAGWREWPEAKLQVVLAHEMAHVRRRDPLIACLAAVNKCLFWFHPLAWWLEQRLAVLAEHVADDAGMAASADAASYARVVLEVAGQMDKQQGRLVWNSAAMAGPLVARRIRRLINNPATRRLTRGAKAALTVTAALLVWVTTAVDFRAVAQEKAMDVAASAGWTSDGMRPNSITAEQAQELESKLAGNPEDSDARLKLLRYYWDANQKEKRAELVFWLIDHHPDSAVLADQTTMLLPRGGLGDPVAFEEARKRWMAQVEYHPADAQILWNAARALMVAGGQPSFDLMQRAQKLDPARFTKPLAIRYSMDLLMVSSPPAGFRQPAAVTVVTERTMAVREALRTSSAAALVGTVAEEFTKRAVEQAMTGPDSLNRAELRTVATELVTRAQALDAGNPKWAALMEGVNRLPDHADPAARAALEARLPQTIRVGANVQAAMLTNAPKPDYPGDAKIHGTVRFQVKVGKDGKVAQIQLMSGDPVLVQPAMDAVKQYVYKPTLLNGVPVEVVTLVEVPL